MHQTLKVTAAVLSPILYLRERSNILYKVFLKKRQCSFSSEPLRYLFKVQASFYLTCCSISLEEVLNCICTQVRIKVNVLIQRNMYPIQNYVQIYMENCLFRDKFSFLSNTLLRMFLSFSLIFWKIQTSVAYKRLAYKKVCRF